MEFIYIDFESEYRTYCKVKRKITKFYNGVRKELEITPFTISGSKREYYKPFYVDMKTEGFEYRIDSVE